MTMQYVRDTYRVPVTRGQVVRQIGSERPMNVTSCTHYVHARSAGEVPRRYHPADLEYLVGREWRRVTEL